MQRAWPLSWRALSRWCPRARRFREFSRRTVDPVYGLAGRSRSRSRRRWRSASVAADVEFRQLEGVDDFDFGDRLREVALVVRDEPVGAGTDGCSEMDRVCGPQPVQRAKTHGQAGCGSATGKRSNLASTAARAVASCSTPPPGGLLRSPGSKSPDPN